MEMRETEGGVAVMGSGFEDARELIGAPRDAPPTPALIVDLPKVRANVDEMARRMATIPAALRPHAKIHKSPILGHMQVEAGAIGLTTATVWEAVAMVAAGIDNVLVANQVVGPRKAAALARIARDAAVIVAVDSAINVDELSSAATEAQSDIGVLVEIDVGLHRSGVRGIANALELGAYVRRMPGLRLLGLLGYEGHCMLEPDRSVRIEKAMAANTVLLEAVDEFERHGLATDIVAAGGLGTWDITGANPRITEIHAGSYIFMDAFHRKLVPGFDMALTVLATVLSRNGSMAVLDCGRKSIGIDRALPELTGGEGTIRFEHGEHFVHEEHTAVMLEDHACLGVGDRVELLPGYAPTTVNLFDLYYIADGERIVDVWPIRGRYGSESTGASSAVTQ